MIHPEWTESFRDADLDKLNSMIGPYSDWLLDHDEADIATFIRGGFPVEPNRLQYWAKEQICYLSNIDDRHLQRNVNLCFCGPFLIRMTCQASNWNSAAFEIVKTQSLIENIVLYEADGRSSRFRRNYPYTNIPGYEMRWDDGSNFIRINKKHKSVLDELIEDEINGDV